MSTLGILVNEPIYLRVEIIWTALIPAFVKEYAADIGMQSKVDKVSYQLYIHASRIGF